MPTIKKRGYAKKQQPEQEIVTIAHRVSDLASQYRKPVLIVTTVIVALLLITGVYSLTRSMKEQKAAPLFASAYGAYSASTGAAPNYARALELFRTVNKNYPSTKSGAIAQYYIGNCLMGLERNDEALKEYQLFLSKYSGNTFLLGLVYERLGYLYTAMGKQPDAVQSFEKAESILGPGISTVELARLYEAAGNNAASQKKYKTISVQLAGTKYAMEASGKVQKIGSPTETIPAKKSK